MASDEPDWKQQLASGEQSTAFTHYALVADGALVKDDAQRGLKAGPCVMSLKVWATGTEQAADMIVSIGDAQGFKIADNVDVYATAPDRAPQDQPYAYDLNFTPYAEDTSDA